MSSASLQAAVIDELRRHDRDHCDVPTLRELRLAVGCSAAELAGAVQALRYQGKLAFDRLELSNSMKFAVGNTSAASEGEATEGAFGLRLALTCFRAPAGRNSPIGWML
jgi:hypothetical protein